MKRKVRTRKAAVTAVGTRSQRGGHGDGSPAGTSERPPADETLERVLAVANRLNHFFRRSALLVVPGFDEVISNAFDEEFIRGDHNDNVDAITYDFGGPFHVEQVNDPTLPASQQIIDVEAKP